MLARQFGITVPADTPAVPSRVADWAPIPDRSVLGSMNDLIARAKARLDDPQLTPTDLSRWLGRTPMTALGMNHPARAFATLRT